MDHGARDNSLNSGQGFYGSNYRGTQHKVIKSKTVDHPRPMNRRFVQKRSVLAFVSLGIVLSFAFLAFNGLQIPSFRNAPDAAGSSERVAAYDWPEDYLNGTVTPIGLIHSDFATYDGKSATVQGNVTAAPGEYDNGYFFIQDSTGGLMVNSSGSGFATFGVTRGEYVRLNGTVAQTVQGMHTIEDALSYWVMDTGNTVEVEHMYNSSLVAASDQGLLAKMNGYLTNFSYSNTSHTSPDWEKSVCTSTLWMYNRTFTVQTTNITLSDYDGFAMVTGVMFYDDGTYTLRPRSTSDIDSGNGPYDYPNVDGDLSDWSSSEIAVDDSDDDTYVTDIEMRCFNVAWDAESLYIGVEYTVATYGSAIIYIDAIPGAGATNVSAFVQSPSGTDWMKDWVRHVEFLDGFAADLMLCRYEADSPELWRFNGNGFATEVTGSMGAIGTGVADGSVSTIEAFIPWIIIYGTDPGEVPPGSNIRIVATVSGASCTNVYDTSPDSPLDTRTNGWSHLVYFYDFCIDCDLDGYPDDYSSGFAIPEFSILIVVPMMVAVMLVVRARRKKT
ncbi:MAG: hypothetical protein IH630_05610 [Thermoplasmata archaeon]|nr:hypothetical protein [Thermoplasmata archaeon]